ncbi:MAG TPA: hemolysin family protein [Longimicrobiales bacterium]|nr:hemolysin family protein [Longimicrobiales bacterium]
MIPSLIIAGLIILNGLFVAAEFAIVGSPRARIEQLAREGNRLAGFVHRVLGNARRQDRYIATAQLGITSASLALGMYGEHLLAEWLARQLEGLGDLRWIPAHSVASVAAVTFLTYLHVVIGEMVPKSLALQTPARVAMVVAVPMRVIELAFYPFVVALNGLGNGLVRLMGIRRTAGGEERYRTADELAFIVAESRAGGLLAREPARVIQELLEFGDLTAGDVLVPRTRMVALPLGADGADVARILETERHTRYPVTDGGPDQIIGVVHVKDLLAALPVDGRLTRDLVREAPFIPATFPLDRILAAMRGARSHLAVVMDEHGGTAGILTLEDLFEEVVGEIGDPGESATLQRAADGSLRAAGTARLDELGEALGREMEHEEVNTVSGLVIATLGRPPLVGDRVRHEGVELEVTAVRDRGVRQVSVLRLPEPEDGQEQEDEDD